MGLTLYFLVYVTLFRLSIIATGVVCIVLGYKLFCRGVRYGEGGTGSESGGSGGSTIEGKISDAASFTLKNAAPGSVFALCGMIIIGVMLVRGTPELKLSEIIPTAPPAATPRAGGVPGASPAGGTNAGTTPAASTNVATTTKPGSRSVTVRSGAKSEFDTLTMEGIEHERQGNLEKAAEAYRKAIRPFMSTANYLAWVYQAEGRLEDALSLSRSTVIVDPDNPDYRDTLAVILCKTGNQSAALEHMQKAAEAGGEFEARLSRMEGGDCE